jgi:hypothetical protein
MEEEKLIRGNRKDTCWIGTLFNMEEEKLVRGNRKDMCWIGTLFNMEEEKYRIPLKWDRR